MGLIGEVDNGSAACCEASDGGAVGAERQRSLRQPPRMYGWGVSQASFGQEATRREGGRAEGPNRGPVGSSYDAGQSQEGGQEDDDAALWDGLRLSMDAIGAPRSREPRKRPQITLWTCVSLPSF